MARRRGGADGGHLRPGMARGRRRRRLGPRRGRAGPGPLVFATMSDPRSTSRRRSTTSTTSPHLGHAYTTIVADALARYHRVRGDDDALPHRHRRARPEGRGRPRSRRGLTAAGASPTRSSARFDETLEAARHQQRRLHPHHRADATRRSSRAVEADRGAPGDIYLGEYEGWYCVGCEAFYTESQLERRQMPGCTTPSAGAVARQGAELLLPAVASTQEPLLAHIEAHPEFIQPGGAAQRDRRRSSKGGLRDLSVSRTSFTWGIPVPERPRGPARHLRVDRRAHELHLGAVARGRWRARLRAVLARRRSTSSARTSCASTRCTGRRS